RRGRHGGHAGAPLPGEAVTEERCSPDELRTLFLFEKLTDDQLDWLCQRGRVEVVPAGPVYAEGDPATHFYVLLDGTVVLSRWAAMISRRAGRHSAACTPARGRPTSVTGFCSATRARCG